MNRSLRQGAILVGALSVLVGSWLILVHARDADWLQARVEALPPASNDRERALQLFEHVVSFADSFRASRIVCPVQRLLARLEHASPLHLSARAVLTAGSDHIGFCGSLTRGLLNLLDVAEIPARKAILYDESGVGVHTVVEVHWNEEWHVLDPTYNWYWCRPEDGVVAGVEDLGSDEALFATVGDSIPGYPREAYTYDDVRYLRWEKVPLLLPIRSALAGWRGEEWTRQIQTPSLYERPRLLVGMTLLGLGFMILGSIALHVWRGHRQVS